MICLKKHKSVKFSEIADIERAKSGVTYAAGSTLIQVSATKGQLVFMEQAGTADGKYAVITPKSGINGRYLYFILDMVLPYFLGAYQTGLNINPEIFKFLSLEIHTERETQEHIAATLDLLQSQIDEEENIINGIKKVKEFHLDKMFAVRKCTQDYS